MVIQQAKGVPVITREEFDARSVARHRAKGLSVDRVMQDLRECQDAVTAEARAQDEADRAQARLRQASARVRDVQRRLELHVAAWPENGLMKQIRPLLELIEGRDPWGSSA